MRRLAAALLALTIGGAPLAALAQGKPAAVTKEQRDQGMKEAPAVAQKAGLTCTVTDAAFRGDTSQGKAYEVACQQGLGYVLLTTGPKAYDCLATAEQKSLACVLPANADPKEGLKPLIAASGATCTPTKARYVGSNATTTVYEAACQEGPGIILEASAPGAPTKPPLGIPCLQAPANMQCTLTTSAQNGQFLTQLVAKSGRTCAVSGSHFLGNDAKSGVAFYEVACGSQPGFVIGANKSGGVDKVLTCGQAQGLAGGCTLTSPAAAAAQQTSEYDRLAKAAGADCTVSKYRDIGQTSKGDDIVELACSNRQDGVVALFPGSPTAHAQVYDCLAGQRFGESAACQLSSPSALYPKYTAALVAKGKTTCQVSGARYVGASSGGAFVELACADGKPGYVTQFGPGETAKDILTCGQAKEAGLACQMPTNALH